MQNQSFSLEDSLCKLYFDFLNENTQKSKSTKEFYARKIAAIKASQIKKNGHNFSSLCMVAESDCCSEINTLFPELFRVPFPAPENPSFTFIDLFSGIGGFHQAMHQIGGKCVLASEIDSFAIDTYLDNYGIDSAHDIRKISDSAIPKHDVLCAGFPCQTFSKAGKQEGFSDQTKGTLFFEIVRILKNKKIRPDYVILENVRNLLSHNKGNIMESDSKNIGRSWLQFSGNFDESASTGRSAASRAGLHSWNKF